LPEGELVRLLGGKPGGSPSQALVNAALAMHANDNVTVVAVEVEG